MRARSRRFAGTCVLATALAGCGASRDVFAPLPSEIAFAAVVFIDGQGLPLAATPLRELDEDGMAQVRIDMVRGADAYLIGYRRQTLAPLLPSDPSWQSAPLRSPGPSEGRLPPADAAYLSPVEGGSALSVDPAEVPFLSVDWLPDCPPPWAQVPLAVDTDCFIDTGSLVSNPVTLGCRGSIPVEGRDAFHYDLSVFPTLTLENGESCIRVPARGDRTVLSADCGSCSVDVLMPDPDLGIQSTTVDLMERQPPFLPILRPPLKGFLEGLAAGPDDTVITLEFGGEFRTGALCEAEGDETFWVRLGLSATPSPSIQVRERRPAAPCATLLRSSPSERSEYFAAFRGQDGAWRWGRFTSDGVVLDSVAIETPMVRDSSPTAAAWVGDRWIVAMGDARTPEEREAEGDRPEGLRPRLWAVDADAARILSGPSRIDRTAPGSLVTDLQGDPNGVVLVGLDENELFRFNVSTLEPTQVAPSLTIARSADVEPEAHVGWVTQGEPSELLYVSLSNTRYSPDGLVVEPENVVHLVRDLQPVADRTAYEALSEVTALAPWSGRPRSVLAGAFEHDTGDSWPPELPAHLMRYDLERPGFAPGRHRVGDGPITALLVDEGEVWGLMGYTGQVFHATLPR